MLKLLTKLAALAAMLMAAPAMAQIQTVDPNQAASSYQSDSPYRPLPDENPYPESPAPEHSESDWVPLDDSANPPPEISTQTYQPRPAPAPGATVPRDDVFTAAEGVFGRGAEGLARILENILRDQGEPVAYIAGQEAGGAVVFGVRYGSGVLHHQVEGERAVYWTGPSLGFDVGADANKVFVLVYNLYDSQELFRRYPGAEGNAYFVGGFTAQYMRRGDVVLIPIRLGVGLRLGVNAGYMRFSERNRWLPF